MRMLLRPARAGDLPPNRFLVYAAAIAALAAVNCFARLGSEFVTEWDESLYGMAAAEILQGADWVGTTLHGQLDYFNSKPPLNFWLIAWSMKLFGATLVALRLPAALSAFVTVLLVMKWVKAAFNDTHALMAGLVLSTSFGFFYVHSGRTANADATLALLTTAAIMTAWWSIDRPRRFLLAGPLIAAAFMVKGLAALLPLIVLAMSVPRLLRGRLTRSIIAGSVLLGGVPLLLWAGARWRVDGVEFFRVLVVRDVLDRSVNAIQGHVGGWFYYLDVIQRYQYDWLGATALALLIVATSWRRPPSAWQRPPSAAAMLVALSCATLFVVPTLMQTKISWYVNPLLPFLAMALAAALTYSLRATSGWRHAAVIGVITLAAVVAESRMVWHSYHRRDLTRSDQGLLLAHREKLAGHTIFRPPWTEADHFVVIHMIGARHAVATDAAAFLAASAPGDFLLQSAAVDEPGLRMIGNDGQHFLYRRD